MVISSSLRSRSNSDALADEFARGAADAGNEVEKVTLREKDIRFCKGCLACQKIGRCVINDDAPAIVGKMHDADVIAFATPIYYYEMCGQLKTLLDRANPLYPSDYRFRDIYMLTSAAEDEVHGAGTCRLRTDRLDRLFRESASCRDGLCRRRKRAGRYSRASFVGACLQNGQIHRMTTILSNSSMKTKNLKTAAVAALFGIGLLAGCTDGATNQKTSDNMKTLNLTQEWDKTFPQSDKVNHGKVTFTNRYGIMLAADMYVPKDASGKLPAIAVCGPFGAVKEQAAGLYAQALAERGFLTIAFRPLVHRRKRWRAPQRGFAGH